MSDSENYVAELHQDRDEARKRALDAEQAVRRVAEAYKAAADRLRSDLVQRTSERDAAREELKSLRYNLMAVTTQEKERTDQLAMAEAACRRDATALGVLQSELDALKAAHAWIKTSERMPADDARVLALVLDNAGNERTEIVTVWSGPVWRYEDNGLQIDPEIITGWMLLPVRMR